MGCNLCAKVTSKFSKKMNIEGAFSRRFVLQIPSPGKKRDKKGKHSKKPLHVLGKPEISPVSPRGGSQHDHEAPSVCLADWMLVPYPIPSADPRAHARLLANDTNWGDWVRRSVDHRHIGAWGSGGGQRRHQNSEPKEHPPSHPRPGRFFTRPPPSG